MATGADFLATIKSVYPYVQETPGLINELNRRAAQGATIDQILTDAPGYGEVSAGAKQYAENRLKPTYNATLNDIALQGNKLDLSGIQAGQAYDELTKTLNEAAKNAQASMEERNNQLGLLQSGNTAAGEGKIASDLSSKLGNAAQVKANALADIALQRAGLANTSALATANYGNDLTDAINKLLEGGNSTRSDMLKQIADAKAAQVKAATTATKKASGSSSAKSSSKATAETKRLNALNQELEKAAVSKNTYVGASATKTREQLIQSLINKYGDIVDPLAIAENVYQNIRNPQAEGDYNGLSQSVIQEINNYVNSGYWGT